MSDKTDMLFTLYRKHNMEMLDVWGEAMKYIQSLEKKIEEMTKALED
jgi:hypothetical protein